MDSKRASLPQLPTDARIARLPKVARLLARRLGYEKGRELLEKFSGRQINVPCAVTPRRCALARSLGEEAAAVLIEHYGGSMVEVPVGRRLERFALRKAILAHPGSHGEAARDLGVTRRWVRMVRTGNRPQRRAKDGVMPLLRALSKKGVRTGAALGELSADEVCEMAGADYDTAAALVMIARGLPFEVKAPSK